MTAVAGFLSFTGDRASGDACARMLAAQSIYGKHSAQHQVGPIALGRHLYPILPEDRHDRAPVVGGEGNLVLVADIRIDNREDFVRALGLSPMEAGERCDAQLLMRGLELWDESCLDRLVGDFAFAFWNGQRQELMLARDCFGRRPLHYFHGDGFFAFASMPKGLHALPDVPYACDTEAIADFLALLPDWGGRSFFEGIRRVEAGHVTTVRGGKVLNRRYWNPPRETLRLRGSEYVEAMQEQLDRAVSARLRGAGERIGTHLSAGLDSTAVTIAAAKLAAREGRGVVAFTAVPRPGFDGPVPPGRFADEGPIAAETAALYSNVEHVRVTTDGRSPLANLDRNFALFDRPMLHLCNGLWGDAIREEAKRRGLTVMLGGAAGNMTITYNGEHLLPELLARGRLVRLLREMHLLRKNGTGLRRSLGLALGPFLPEAPWKRREAQAKAIDSLLRHSLLNPSLASSAEIAKRAAARGHDFAYAPRRDGFATRLWVLQRMDPGLVQKGNLAGWGIDSRDPTADRRLVEWCLRVPLEEYHRDGVPRSLGRRLLEGKVSPNLLAETRRGYQAADWHEGLRADRKGLRAEVGRIAAVAEARELLDVERLGLLAELEPKGDWAASGVVAAYRLALLRGVSVGHFVRRVSGSNG